MKTNILLTILLTVHFIQTNAQGVINPYADYSIPDPVLNPSGEMPHYQINNGGLYFNFTSTPTGYSNNNGNGEYMINFRQLPWLNNYSCNYIGNSIYGLDFNDIFAKSYKIEVVGFPFVMNDALTIGCGDNTSIRNLELPNFALDDDQTVAGTGTNVWRMKSNIPIGITGNGEFSDLITHNYNSTSPISAGLPLPYYPHTTHKITIFIHCGNDASYPIVDQISFFYDFTRGRMRDYPFTTTNTQTGYNAGNWDFTIRPNLILKNYDIGHSYQETSNSDIFLNGTTIDYFPFLSNSNCSNFSDISKFYYSVNTYSCPVPANEGLVSYIHTPTFALSSILAYHGYGYDHFAGYDYNNSVLSIQPGVKHNYLINNNYDLSNINSSEQTIYNPSEVTFTTGATNFVFPEGFTFKTIRGLHPTATEVNNDDISENGGPYADLRDVPVTTDLTSENPTDAANFPLSAQTATQHLYASRYYLQDGSKLTINNCVRLLDATFDVKQGGTLWCTDYPTIVGKEDHSFDRTHTRFKFQTLGGAVLRNGTPIQYLQNGIITQSIPLHYKANDEIQAGNSVNDNYDTDVDHGDYSVEPTGDVTLEAANTIFLKDGFRAKEGSNFRAYTAAQASSVSCPPLMRSANRMTNQPTIEQPNETIYQSVLNANPNPSSGLVNISYSNGLLITDKIQVMNSLGKVVFEKKSFNSSKDKIDVSNEPDGIYIATVFNNKSVESVKFVLQK